MHCSFTSFHRTVLLSSSFLSCWNKLWNSDVVRTGATRCVESFMQPTPIVSCTTVCFCDLIFSEPGISCATMGYLKGLWGNPKAGQIALSPGYDAAKEKRDPTLTQCLTWSSNGLTVSCALMGSGGTAGEKAFPYRLVKCVVLSFPAAFRVYFPNTVSFAICLLLSVSLSSSSWPHVPSSSLSLRSAGDYHHHALTYSSVNVVLD